MQTSATRGTYPARPTRYPPPSLPDRHRGAAVVAPAIRDDQVGRLAAAELARRRKLAVLAVDRLDHRPRGGVEGDRGRQVSGRVQPWAEAAVQAVVLEV